jgi:phosphoglucosamine mutase
LLNVKVRERCDLASIDPIAKAIQHVTCALGDKGRLLVRYSGTEPLVRVMVEGEDEKLVHAYGEEVAGVVRMHLGV